MADFTPKKVKPDASKAKGSLATDNTEHQAPPVLHLEDHHMKALGLHNQPPGVGSKVKISGVAHVGAVSENQSQGPSGAGRKSMTLHLHQMDVGTDKQQGVSDESQKDGMKSEIDKALTKHAGSAAAKGKAPGKTPTPRGGGD